MDKKYACLLLLGGNIGDTLDYFSKAKSLIEAKIGSVKEQSKIYTSEPWGNTEQDVFKNQAITVETGLEYDNLMRQIHTIEDALGRIRDTKWGSRTIDIDIIMIENVKYVSDILTIPHPYMHERNFVLVPSMEIAGEWMHPILESTIEDLYWSSTDRSEVYL
jgi:2-amino-4-hydroxy-6-hydroxymethyldihydropteridine diphosphokinase